MYEVLDFHRGTETGKQYLCVHLRRVFVFYCASHRPAGPQNLLDSTLELLCAAPVSHDPSYFNDIVQAQVAAVSDVLLLHQGPDEA